MRNLLLKFAAILLQLQGLYSANESRPCGLPSDLDTFPDFAQEELRDVWSNYVPGNDCSRELQTTDDIIAVLLESDFDVDGERKKPRLGVITGSTEALSITRAPFISTTVPFLAPTPMTLAPIVFPLVENSSGKGNLEEKRVATWSRQSSFTATRATIDSDRLTVERLVATTTAPSTTTGEATVTIAHISTTTPRATSQRASLEETTISPENDEEPEERRELFLDRKLPFLAGANHDVIQRFHRVFNDHNINSEAQRQQRIHLLAVSHLNAEQLRAYSTWATRVRAAARLRDQQTSKAMSLPALQAMRRLRVANDVFVFLGHLEIP